MHSSIYPVASIDKQCKCHTIFHRAYKMMILDVPQFNARKRAWDDSHRNICSTARHFVEIHFKCNSCCCEFSCVTEFDHNGKHWYLHEIGMSRLSLRFTKLYADLIPSLLGSEIVAEWVEIERSYEFVKQQYDSMPDNGYHLNDFNSIHWAKKFYNRLNTF
ncbi:hypothetical protein Ddc_09281 [Ditylenchus destructor]|nr:hypothetical protein Ddc_09281 [Ditylenchus destructor]